MCNYAVADVTECISAEVRMPSGKIDLPIVEDNRDGTVRVQYDPREAGIHELILTHDGVPVPGKSSLTPNSRSSH